MAHKKKHVGRIPPGNKAKTGMADGTRPSTTEEKQPTAEVASFQEEDPKGRMGDFKGDGRASIKEPGGHNDANR